MSVLSTWQDPLPKTQPSPGSAEGTRCGDSHHQPPATATATATAEAAVSGASQEKGISPQKPPGKALGTLLPEAMQWEGPEASMRPQLPPQDSAQQRGGRRPWPWFRDPFEKVPGRSSPGTRTLLVTSFSFHRFKDRLTAGVEARERETQADFTLGTSPTRGWIPPP